MTNPSTVVMESGFGVSELWCSVVAGGTIMSFMLHFVMFESRDEDTRVRSKVGSSVFLLLLSTIPRLMKKLFSLTNSSPTKHSQGQDVDTTNFTF